jgi:hypothetical protein
MRRRLPSNRAPPKAPSASSPCSAASRGRQSAMAFLAQHHVWTAARHPAQCHCRNPTAASLAVVVVPRLWLEGELLSVISTALIQDEDAVTAVCRIPPTRILANHPRDRRRRGGTFRDERPQRVQGRDTALHELEIREVADITVAHAQATPGATSLVLRFRRCRFRQTVPPGPAPLVGRTPGISCKAPLRSGFVSFIPLLDGLVPTPSTDIHRAIVRVHSPSHGPSAHPTCVFATSSCWLPGPTGWS